MENLMVTLLSIMVIFVGMFPATGHAAEEGYLILEEPTAAFEIDGIPEDAMGQAGFDEEASFEAIHPTDPTTPTTPAAGTTTPTTGATTPAAGATTPTTGATTPTTGTITTVTVGDFTVTYKPSIEYTGKAIKVTDLGLNIRHKNGNTYTPSSVAYKANKNAGTGTFRVKTLKVTKADKALKKELKDTTFSFTIQKRQLTAANTEIKLTKQSAVKSVKAIITTTNTKGKSTNTKYTIPKKQWRVSDGYVIILPANKNFTGAIKYF